MKAVLPVAGNGTRMYPLGVTTPKALIPILNKPLIEWTLEAIKQIGIEEVVIVTSAGTFGTLISEYVEQHIKGQSSVPTHIHIVTQEQQLGTAHVIQQAKDYFDKDEEFVFLYGDDLYGKGNIAAVLQSPGLAVVGKEVEDPEKWGIFACNEAGALTKVVEKPQEYVGNLASIGCMKLSSRIFEVYDQVNISVRGEYEITDSLQLLAAQSEIAVIKAPDYWIPIGYPWHILDATEAFLAEQESSIQGTVAANTYQSGSLVLPKSSTILPGCYLEGNILVGEHVTIGPNARIRGNTVIGNHSVIGFGVDLKNSVVGESCKIPHLSYVGDTVMGKNCRVSAGAMIANRRHDRAVIATPIKGIMTPTGRTRFGSILGDNVRLGINSSVYPGRKIWPNIATRPGQVVDRDLAE